MQQRSLPLPFPLDLAGTVRSLHWGPYDPTCRMGLDGFWRASRAPSGPATLHVHIAGDRLEARAWGDGAQGALDAIEDLVGLNDDVSDFEPGDGVVGRLWRQFPHRRVTRSLAVAESLVASILEQRVTTFEAHRSFRQIVDRWGEPAPGPTDLRLLPSPDVLAGLAYYDLHALGVEKKRADTVRRVGANANRLDALAREPVAVAHRRLTETHGVGPWTAASVALRALGDADAVPVGDVHLPSDVTYAVTGTATNSDDAMLEVLEPFAGHRGRVIQILMAAGIHAPRRAPRYSPRDVRDA